MKQVRTLLAPFVLRRLKSQVLQQLAPKTTHEVYLTPTSEQQRLYDNILRRHVERQKDAAAAKGTGKSRGRKKIVSDTPEEVVVLDSDDESFAIAESRSTSDGTAGVDERDIGALVGSDRDAKNVFVELRKAANHPLLLLERYREEAKMKLLVTKLFGYGHFGDQCTAGMVRKELDSYSDLDLHQLCSEYGGSLAALELPFEALLGSAKIRWLMDNLPRLVEEGHRVLIFSQWTKLLDVRNWAV